MKQEAIMLQLKQSVNLEYYLDFSLPTSVNDLVKRGTGDLVYFFLPEDTTDNTARERKDSIGLAENNPRSTTKVIFWLVASIAIPLMLGQVK
jgi:hypothetical protein